MSENFERKIAVLDQKARQDELKQEEERIRKARHNTIQFVQIEKKTIASFRKLMVTHVAAANVLMMLAERMNRQNAVMMSYETMEKLTGYKKSSITKAIATLKKGNWIEVIKVGTANAYRINSRAFWQSYGDKKFTSFSAQIVTFDDEQPNGVIDCKEELMTFPFVEVSETVLLTGDEGDPPVNQEMDLV